MENYYVRTKDNIFYDLMTNTEREDLLSDEEKSSLYQQALASRAFMMFEGGEISEDEWNFSIYGLFNGLSADEMLEIILERSLGLKVNFAEIERRYNGYLPVME